MDDVAVSAALDRLSELEKEATPGPWVETDTGSVEEHYVCTLDGFGMPASNRALVGPIHDCDGHHDGGVDAALIVAARNALPALLAVARAAEACESEWTALGALDGPDDLDDDFDALRAALAALDAP